MKPLLATLVAIALYASTGGPTPGHAAETDQTLEPPTTRPLGLPMEDKRGQSPKGVLSCALEDQKSAEIHVLLCRFEDSESCILTNPTPLRTLMLRYEDVKILMIGATAEGCSKLTFTGSLKTK